MTDKTRPYLFYDTCTSICSTCCRKVDGKVVFQDGAVYMLKRCPEHGGEKVLVADDVEYYRRAREVFIKPPEQPLVHNTPVRWGCPYDCGTCPDHEQHACLALVEITDECNLRCPTCYAGSGPDRKGQHRSLAHIEAMLDAVVRNEGEPDIVQISGGEPTLHPRFWDILDAAKRRPIKHLMLNTNGVRIATEPGFAERLATYMPGFEVYLQFDSLEEGPLRDLRGADLREVRRRAIANLNRCGVSTNLVVVVKKGLNDHELGAIIDYALKQPCVRGVTFQPVQHAGRTEGFDPAKDRLTLTEVRRRILQQSPVFAPEDLIPVPCHPDALAMAYALKLPAGNGSHLVASGQEPSGTSSTGAANETGVAASETPLVVPLTSLIDPKVLVEGRRNTIVYEKDDDVRRHIFGLFSTAHSPQSGMTSLKELLCCLPQAEVPEGLGYQNLFRVIIMQFIDAHAFDIRSVKKACVSIVHPDGRLIPFDTYNLFYRDGLESTRLAPLRAREEARDRMPGEGGLPAIPVVVRP